MYLSNIEKMLASAPDVAHWWQTNKETIENFWKRSAKCEQSFFVSALACGAVASVLSFLILCHMVPLFLGWGILAGLVGFVGLGFIAMGAGQRRWEGLSQHYKTATDRWGLSPTCAYKEFSRQRRATLVTNLNELGVDPHYIIQLRHLDLPNSWWHKMNEQVCVAKKQEQIQSISTWEDVFVQVEQRTQSPKIQLLRL